MKQPSQIELYGELLTVEQQYHHDIADIPRMTMEEEERLIVRARSGDTDAKEHIILSCLGYVQAVARKYTVMCAANGRHLVEYLDLIQVGNLTLVKCSDKALDHPSPFGYLKRAASGEIVKYCMKHGTSITCPSERGGKILPMKDVSSLEQPLTPETQELTLADTLEAPPVVAQEEKDYTMLYSTLETLTPKQRDVIVRHYGLGCASEDLFTISCAIRHADGKPFKDSANEAYGPHKRALTTLQKQLEHALVCA